VFDTTIHGGQVSLAAAGQGEVAQNVTQTIGEPQTIADITTQLRAWGLRKEDVRELEQALTADRDTSGGELVIGERTESWIRRVAACISTGAIRVAENVSVETIVAILTKLVGG
jgi:hypothetical protein